MPIDPATLDSDIPRTFDGRSYPDHLRAYERYDPQFLSIAAELGQFTMDELIVSVADRKLQSTVPRWLASVEWRGLIERQDLDLRSPRLYSVTERGRDRIVLFDT